MTAQRLSAWLPFADAASDRLPFSKLLRLSLFQVSVGMATVLLMGTLNRVMIVELGIAASLIAVMAALPVLIAPMRAVLGFKSDSYRSAIGWKRVPYLWFGSLWQFGGLAIMPFALIVLSGDQAIGPAWAGPVGAGLAFLMVGLGVHMTQTAGLALASDLADETTRPRVVAFLYVMLLLGMGLSALIFGWLLSDFSKLTLIRVVQGAAVMTLALNLAALWKQEALQPMSRAAREVPAPKFSAAWADLMAGGQAGRLLLAVFLGTMAFAMQDILLEPYGGEILGLSVGETTMLTALWAIGALAGFALAANRLSRGQDPVRTAALGLVAGVMAFSAVVFAAPLGSALVFSLGAMLIGFGSGLFAVSLLTRAMELAAGKERAGLALGAWGAASATATGLGVAAGGILKDWISTLALSGRFGTAFQDPALGYQMVYHVEILLLFLTLIVCGRLVRRGVISNQKPTTKFGLTDLPV